MMSSRTVRRQETDADRVSDRFVAAVSSNCAACSGCGARASSVRLPDAGSDTLVLQMSIRTLVGSLLHSLVLPIFVVVATALACSLFAVPEPGSIVLLLMSLTAGVALCRAQPATLLKVDEVS